MHGVRAARCTRTRRSWPTSSRSPPRSPGPATARRSASCCSSSPCPGMPDVYQGDELLSLSLVDPDNRRAVDWERRRELLESVRRGAAPTEETRKLWLIVRALVLRRSRPDAFAGAYSRWPPASGRSRSCAATPCSRRRDPRRRRPRPLPGRPLARRALRRRARGHRPVGDVGILLRDAHRGSDAVRHFAAMKGRPLCVLVERVVLTTWRAILESVDDRIHRDAAQVGFFTMLSLRPAGAAARRRVRARVRRRRGPRAGGQDGVRERPAVGRVRPRAARGDRHRRAEGRRPDRRLLGRAPGGRRHRGDGRAAPHDQRGVGHPRPPAAAAPQGARPRARARRHHRARLLAGGDRDAPRRRGARRRGGRRLARGAARRGRRRAAVRLHRSGDPVPLLRAARCTASGSATCGPASSSR